MILIYEWGFLEREVGDVLGVSKSRISQMHAEAVQALRKISEGRIPQEKQRKREQEKQGKVSRQIQRRPSLYQKALGIFQEDGEKEGSEMGERKKQKVRKALFKPFRVKTF